MNNFIFRVTPHQEITVELNSKFLFIHDWNKDKTTEENVLAAMRAAERLRNEMSEQGKRAAEAGRQLKEEYLYGNTI